MNSWWFSGLTVLLGLIGFIFLALRSKWKITKKNLEDYSEGRDKLTHREEKVEDEYTPEFSGGILVNIISGFIVILVGASLIPFVNEQVDIAIATQNITSEITYFSFDLINLFFALTVAVVGISIAYTAFSNKGLL